MLNGVWDEDGYPVAGIKKAWTKKRSNLVEGEEKYMGTTKIYENNLSVKRNIIKHLYMNSNNICNFKCRMCGDPLQ